MDTIIQLFVWFIVAIVVVGAAALLLMLVAAAASVAIPLAIIFGIAALAKSL